MFRTISAVARAKVAPHTGAKLWSAPSGLLQTRSTTILAVRKDGELTMVGDGQVTQGQVVIKSNTNKIRRIGDDILLGFAGSSADCLALAELLESKLEEHPGQLVRACVALAKEWRMNSRFERVQASLLVADRRTLLELTGTGDVLEPAGQLMAIGSGGAFAIAAARALVDVPGLSSKDIALKAMNIAADMCVYTNHNFVVESLHHKD